MALFWGGGGGLGVGVNFASQSEKVMTPNTQGREEGLRKSRAWLIKQCWGGLGTEDWIFHVLTNI